MRDFLRIIIVAIVSMSMASCATVLKDGPSPGSEHLAIGTVMLHAENYKDHGSATINGTHVAGVILTFQDLSTEETITARSQPQTGLFYFPIEPESHYQLIEIYFESSGTGGFGLSLTQTTYKRKFASGNSRVVNLGHFYWEANKLAEKFKPIAMQKQHEEVRAIVEEKYPDSGWLDYDWTPLVLE